MQNISNKQENEQQLILVMTAALEYAVNYEAAKHSSGRRTMRYSTENTVENFYKLYKRDRKKYISL